MSQLSGADVGGLRQLGLSMESAARQLQQAIAEIASTLGSAAWKGPDARAFHHLWDATLRMNLSHVSDALRNQGTSLRRQADEQEHASAGGGSGGPGTGGPPSLGNGGREAARHVSAAAPPPWLGAPTGLPRWDPQDPGNYDRDGDGYVDGCFPRPSQPDLPVDIPGDVQHPAGPPWGDRGIEGPVALPLAWRAPGDHGEGPRLPRFPEPPRTLPWPEVPTFEFPRFPWEASGGRFPFPAAPLPEDGGSILPAPHIPRVEPQPGPLPFPRLDAPGSPWDPQPFPLAPSDPDPWPRLDPMIVPTSAAR